ncbi:MAG TPA: site-specific DNA-methyltransferase [Caldithrix abyssi]|uniref:Methyltransferase n=1 Tax=Caldithrix abyssi TaxID=187145 RepID=A0A7V4WV71_CALAY|nr:site-specific DNA-methyltransferase [Caldithrix abyssi]
MKTKHTCIIGDSRKMIELDDASVHLVVTSPPYWQLKDYGTEQQIGFNDSYEDYINNLNLVWDECYRVLHPGCRMLVNVGDQFARAVYYGRYKVIPIRTEIIKFCETIGFDYMGAIIWQKKTTMNTTGGATVMGSYPYPRNGIVEIDYEFILIFKKPGNPPKVSKEIKEQSIIPKQKWKEYFSGHWYFNGVRQDGHIAMFPVELPKRAIEMFTFVGETVLDPFLGSGTTALAAIVSNRNSIGYEINEEFIPIVEKKLESQKDSLFNEFEFNTVRQNLPSIDWNKEIEKLKYVFKDPVNFKKKIDPNKLKFGSKVSVKDAENGVKREEYYTVKEIIRPNLIRLNNDLEIRLIGVKPIAQLSEAAGKYLTAKILRRQVFLKYDTIKYDSQNRLMAYVYMKNKTFINAHLLKEGLVEVDTEYPFKLFSKFEKLRSIKATYENSF